MSPRPGYGPKVAASVLDRWSSCVSAETSADRERRDVFEHRVECGFEGGGIAVNLGEEEPSMDGGEQGDGQSVGVSGSSEVTALVSGP
jgi:hypothetical protein